MEELTERQIYGEWRDWDLRRRWKTREMMIKNLPQRADHPIPNVPDYDQWCANGKINELRFRHAVAAFSPREYDEFLSRIPLRVQ
jgi:hypothetical protein